MMETASALYIGTVTHHRLRPVTHALRYRVFSLLLDLDELPALSRRLRLFAHNRAAPVALHDRDHGGGDSGEGDSGGGDSGNGAPLRAWAHRHLTAAGVTDADGPVRLLCYPRLWGYGFNPLTVWWCHRRDGSLAAVLHEVHNTFGERHTYLIPVPRTAAEPADIRQQVDKRFHVSPFLPMDLTYHFSLRPPAERVAVAIDERDADGQTVLRAAFTGRRRALTDAALARVLVTHPLMTLKVIGGIHWEALRLWRKGLRIHRRPADPPATAVSLGHPSAPEPATAEPPAPTMRTAS